MDDIRIEFDDHPSAEDLRQVVDGVREYNLATGGQPRPRSVACFLKNADGAIIGGAHGELWGRSVHIAAVWVTEGERGKRYGAALLIEVERYAAMQGQRFAYVETLSYQARPFYESLGYRVFGQLDGIDDGCTLFFLRKDLDVPSSASD